MTKSSTVFIVDDDPAVRKSLQWLIESAGFHVQAFSSARTFLEDYDCQIPGCVVLDIRMPGMSGLELQEQLRKQGHQIPIIVVTGYGDVSIAVRAMKGGALDFVEKPVSDRVLLDHITRAIALDKKRHKKLAAYTEIHERAEILTNREREVMQLVVEGLSSKRIAEQLGVSYKTIEAHRGKIMYKMQADNMPQLIHMALTLSEKVT